MKLNITHKKETSGLLSKKTRFVVYVEGQFTHEEMAIIAENGYEQNKMFDRPYPDDEIEETYSGDILSLHFNISHLMQGKPDRWSHRHSYAAMTYENQVLKACEEFKEVLEVSGGYQEGTRTVEI